MQMLFELNYWWQIYNFLSSSIFKKIITIEKSTCMHVYYFSILLIIQVGQIEKTSSEPVVHRELFF